MQQPTGSSIDHAGDVHDHAGNSHDHAGHSHDHRELGRRRLATVLVITAAFMVVELVGGLLSNSLALVADAGHMLSDVAAIALSIFALWFSRRPATQQKSYGYHRFEILAAFVNGMTLVVIALLILWQAYTRLVSPQPVVGSLMLAIAMVGLCVNIAAAFLLHSSAGHSLNVRGAYLHVLSDMLGSVGAIAAGIIIITTGWTAADPIISAIVALLILASSWRLVRESVDILLEAVPSHIDLNVVRSAIGEIDGVEEVHDLHVWTLTSGYLAMSGHAVIADPMQYKEVLQSIHDRMHERFGIDHVTVQIEHRTLYSLRRD
ncbi:MAG: cation diffusion facilitator family transporter [Longimicrobiales bacterium]